MQEFFKVSFYSVTLILAFYLLIGTALTTRFPPNFIAFTNSSSLNHSLHRSYQNAGGYVVGSSIALGNLDAGLLSDELHLEFQTIGGYGLMPLETLSIIRTLEIKNTVIIIPLCIRNLNELTTSPDLNWNPQRLKDFEDFLTDYKLYNKSNKELGNIEFTKNGNVFVPSCENGAVMPLNHGRVFHSRFREGASKNYVKTLIELQVERNLDIHLVVMPYSTNYFTISEEDLQLVQTLVSELENSDIRLHNFLYDECDFEKFIDDVHMSNYGAVAFTHSLIRQLKEYRFKTPEGNYLD